MNRRNRSLVAFFLLVAATAACFVANQILRIVKVTLTQENARLVCFDFEKLIAEYSGNIPPQSMIDAALAKHIATRFNHAALDNWNRPMRIVTSRSGPDYHVTVRSAGVDGQWNTADDVVVEQTVSVGGASHEVIINGR